ncbi:MAG TPA: hypothetical protein VEK08_02405 [Planctomycetota bacterium]|nr:hypothetical protein [Planctomycetota bacterium]
MPSGRFVRANELQQKSISLLRDLSVSGEPCYITEDGKAKAVLMDINRYNALMDLVEEAESPKDHDHVGDETRKHVSVRGIISRRTTVRRRR